MWGAQDTPLGTVCLVLASEVAGPDSPTSEKGDLGPCGVIFLFEMESKVAQTGILGLLIPSYPLSAGITGVQAPLIAVHYAWFIEC